MMLLFGIWHNNYSLRYVSTTHVQFAFSVGTVFVLSAIQAISGPRLGRVTLASSLSQIETCLEYLTIIGKSWETAECAKEILLKFFDDTLKPRLLLRGGDANLKFELPNVERTNERVHVSSNASKTQQHRELRPNGKIALSPASSNISPITPSTVHSLSDLQYFQSTPSTVTLGWPLMNPPVYSHPNVSSPAVSSSLFHHRIQDTTNNMDLDVGYQLGMNMTITSDLPGPLPSVSMDMMSFGVPELGVGYQFDPHACQAPLEFSEEELAIMNQICRQQGQTILYAGQV
jgi:hypothetical protein